MLLNGKEAALCVRQDWEALLKIWPALCSAKYTDKPSVIVLFDMAQDIVVNNFSSFQITYNIPESVFPLAEKVSSFFCNFIGENNVFILKLIEPYEDCIHNPVWPTPTRNEYTQIHDAEKERNDKSLKLYNRLCTELLNLSTSSKLHRRKVELAEAYLTLLLRRDLNMPDGCVQLFFRLLTSDVNKTRKQAVSMVGSWLKITKPKSLKMLHPIAHMDPNNGPGSSWPICYGYRKDNRMLLFDSRKQPINGQEWDNTRFFYKFHWGFYTWPKEFKSYAAPASQNMVIILFPIFLSKEYTFRSIVPTRSLLKLRKAC